MSSTVTYPVQVLRQHVTALEAALSVCLAEPSVKPVHRLRTETRRVEALLLLMARVPDLPEHAKEAAALLRSLRRLRRAAGEVRDLDVHRKMLEVFAATEREAASKPPAKAAARGISANVTEKKGAVSQSKKVTQALPVLLSHAATELRETMGEDREKAAEALQELLQRRQTKTAKAAEALLAALEPAKELALPADDLLRDAEAVLLRDGYLKRDAVEDLKESKLHQVRKSAKAARYLAETLPENDALAEAARRFEALQEAGGQWHDALELARAARRHFGRHHELTTQYREQRDTKLKAYQAALSALAKQSASAGRRRPERARKAAGKRKSAA